MRLRSIEPGHDIDRYVLVLIFDDAKNPPETSWYPTERDAIEQWRRACETSNIVFANVAKVTYTSNERR